MSLTQTHPGRAAFAYREPLVSLPITIIVYGVTAFDSGRAGHGIADDVLVIAARSPAFDPACTDAGGAGRPYPQAFVDLSITVFV